MSTSSSEDSEDSDDDVSSRNLILITTIINAIAQYTSGLYNKQEYHMSMLSGYAWVLELRNGHPDCIRCYESPLGVLILLPRGLLASM